MRQPAGRDREHPGVDAAIAIHADGAAGGDHGFHLCVDSRRPEDATARRSPHTRGSTPRCTATLAASSGLSVANYVGRNGYYYRDDLAGLNLSTKPTAFLELGNMRNGADAHRQSTRPDAPGSPPRSRAASSPTSPRSD